MSARDTFLARQPVALPDRVGQGTAVEQSRAVAQVQAAAIMAKQYPRDEDVARARILQACRNSALAEQAFYSVPRGDKIATNSSIHLARELARIWGNLDFGVTELRRDDTYGQSEMQAYCWDLETNARVATTFIVPHRRDLRGGNSYQLTSMADIYESNANNGARRLRECIRTVIPRHVFDEAEAACRATARKPVDDKGAEVPLAEQIEKALAWLAMANVTVERVEARLGKPRTDWDGDDVLALRTLSHSINRGETTIAEAFPQQRITAEAIAEQAAAATPAAPRELGVALASCLELLRLPESGPEVRDIVGQIIGRPVEPAELTGADLRAVIDLLAQAAREAEADRGKALDGLLAAAEANREQA